MSRLAGKVAVITGGGSRIGLAAARLFAQEGAQISGHRHTIAGNMANLNDLDRLIARRTDDLM